MQTHLGNVLTKLELARGPRPRCGRSGRACWKREQHRSTTSEPPLGVGRCLPVFHLESRPSSDPLIGRRRFILWSLLTFATVSPAVVALDPGGALRHQRRPSQREYRWTSRTHRRLPMSGQAPCRPPRTFLNPQLHQAEGMAAVQLGVGLDEAVARLRIYAAATDQWLTDVACSVVERRLQLSSPTTVRRSGECGDVGSRFRPWSITQGPRAHECTGCGLGSR